MWRSCIAAGHKAVRHADPALFSSLLGRLSRLRGHAKRRVEQAVDEGHERQSSGFADSRPRIPVETLLAVAHLGQASRFTGWITGARASRRRARTRSWLPSVSRRGGEGGSRVVGGGSGKWLIRSVGVGM